MNESLVFQPPRRTGFLFQVIVIGLFISCFGITLSQALKTPIGVLFLLLFGLAVIFFLPLPVLLYRIYALFRSRYVMQRDGIHLQWGLRSEDIPLNEVLWVSPTSELSFRLALPWIYWPGSIQGVRNTKELGIVEYMASDASCLVLIATEHRVFAISPNNPISFLRAFQQATEMGSLSPMAAASVYPTFILGKIWSDRLARYLLLSGLLLNAILLVFVSLIISTRKTISLGYTAAGLPVEAGPATGLLLLPILSAFFYVIDLISGIYFFRLPEERLIAYILWGSSIITPFLLIIGAYIIRAT